jgi:hypothetical protein
MMHIKEAFIKVCEDYKDDEQYPNLAAIRKLLEAKTMSQEFADELISASAEYYEVSHDAIDGDRESCNAILEYLRKYSVEAYDDLMTGTQLEPDFGDSTPLQ